jgi:hypothetical protein
MFVYSCEPCDWWHGWRKPEEVVGFPGRGDAEGYEGAISPEEWVTVWRLAQEGAQLIGWEGDIRRGEGGPWVTMLPMPGNVTWLVAWKQDNNGTTFIASPVALPWLTGKHGGASEWIKYDGKERLWGRVNDTWYRVV